MSTVTTQLDMATGAAVAVLTIANPPVNAMSMAVRADLLATVRAAAADPAVQALVLIGAGGKFIPGADIREFGKALTGPSGRDVIAAIEACPKPVVAALGGNALGGGLEIALGCHWRVAEPGCKLGLPEVNIGLLPGAGGTQRLTRLVGPAKALEMITTGKPISAAEALQCGVVDALIEGDLLAGALAFAQKVVAEKRPLKKVRDMKVTHPAAEAFLDFAKTSVKAVAKNFPAPVKCIEAIAASVDKPFEEGLKAERELFLALMQTPESRALRHAFFAERAAAKIPDLPEDTKTRKVDKVAVIGAGTMGGGIAMNFLNAGIPVTILETKQEALDRGLATIRKNYEGTVKKGRLTADKMEQRLGLLKPTLSYDDLKDADLVIEAVFEEIGVKEQVFKKLDEVAKPGAILASNTSTLDVDKIASFTKRPGDVVGMHFFSPANVMKLLEVVRGKKSAPDVLATVMGIGKKIKKTAVVSGVCDGFIGNRMLKYYGRQANELVEEGASPQQVDRAMEKFGFAMGPFRVADLAGNDIGFAIRKRLYAEDPKARKLPIADAICEMGRFGQKTGAGWYRYEAGKRDAIPDPVVDKVIEDVRKAQGITPRKISDDEIVERCVYALVNEGARIVEEGIAQRASDVDMVYLTGYGFPLFRGGPMLYADMVGLPNVVRSMEKFRAQTKDEFWKPAALLSRLAAEGKTFN